MVARGGRRAASTTLVGVNSSSTSDDLPEPGHHDDGAPARGMSGSGASAGGPAGHRAGRAAGAKKAQRPWYVEIPMLVVIALVLVFVFQTFVGRVYRIPSESMEPTLHGCAGCNGDRIFVDKISYRFSEPEPGDVVVFKGPDSWNDGYRSIRSANPAVKAVEDVGAFIGIVPPDENDLVKRVVAVGGQTVGGCSPQGALLVDGKALDEPYLHDDPAIYGNRRNCEFGPVTVPEGNVWVMGDNRNNSADSRYHMADEYQGTVPVDLVIGKVRAVILPVSRIGGVDSPHIAAR